jgi:hypothetical protein
VSGEHAPKNVALGAFPDAGALLPQPGGFEGFRLTTVGPHPNDAPNNASSAISLSFSLDVGPMLSTATGFGEDRHSQESFPVFENLALPPLLVDLPAASSA